MRFFGCVVLLVLTAIATVACGVEPKPRELPAGFANPRFMLISDQAQGPLLIGGDYGMQISLDGGRTWQPTDNGTKPAVAAASYGNNILISRGTTAQIYGSVLTTPADPAAAWPFSGAVTELAGNARRDRIWAIASDGGNRLMYSNDGGNYWWTMSAIGLCRHPRALAVGAPKGKLVERLWVACGQDGLFASDDLGVNFVRVPGISNALTVAAARSQAGQIAVTTPQVVVTKDSGLTWYLSGLTASAVAIDPRNPDLVFAAGSGGRLYASLDGGKSF